MTKLCSEYNVYWKKLLVFPDSIPFLSIQKVIDIDDSTPAECESEKNVIKYIETGESWCETFAKS